MLQSLKQSRIAILGLGLMGGSLAMALRGKCSNLFGIDRDPRALAFAEQKGIVDRVSSDAGQLLPHADLIILATPVSAIIDLLHELPSLHPGSAMVFDLGSTKVEILKGMQALPSRYDPIGGHPMCGKEVGSLENADPDIYQGAPFALVPLQRTSTNACHIAEELVESIGGRPEWMDGETHDRRVALTSHLPYLLANALASSLPLEVAPLVGPGLRSTFRLAASPVSMMTDILITNRANVLTGLRIFQDNLAQLEKLLQENVPGNLQEFLEAGRFSYLELMESIPR
jgi:prephenate dehydrogenase